MFELTVPNVLTVFRILLVPVLVTALLSRSTTSPSFPSLQAQPAPNRLSSLKGAALIPDAAAAARTAAAIGEAALANDLELLECNPVLVHRDGAVVVDATAKEVSS